MLERSTPASIEAEKALLCSLLLDPKRVMSLCQERRVSGDSFHFPGHAALYRAAEDLWGANKPVDLVSITTKLHAAGQLESAGGAPAVSEIFCYLPTAINAEHYLAIVREKELLRKIIQIGTEFVNRAYEEPEDPQQLVTELERAALSLVIGAPEEEVEFGEHVMRSLDRAQERSQRGSGMSGLPTGIHALDKLTGGLCSPDLVVVSAETSGGKTALACKFVAAAAVHADKPVPVAVYSYEMTNEEVTDRLLVSDGRVNMLNFRQGWLNEGDYQGLTLAASRLKDAKIFLKDDAEMNINQVRASARRIKARHGLGLIVIDYAQLVPESSGKKGANREQEVAYISRQCKAMAKELNVPVVILSQLNDEGKMRESRAIAHDANMVLVIQQEEAKDGGEPRHFIRIGKQRNGPRDRVEVKFLKQYTRFEDK